MSDEICGDLRVGDLIKWTYKYDAKFRLMTCQQTSDRIYSYSKHCAVPISNSCVLVYFDKTSYYWLCKGKIYSSFWMDDYFKAKL
jgi:hypothetical protein